MDEGDGEADDEEQFVDSEFVAVGSDDDDDCELTDEYEDDEDAKEPILDDHSDYVPASYRKSVTGDRLQKYIERYLRSVNLKNISK